MHGNSNIVKVKAKKQPRPIYQRPKYWKFMRKSARRSKQYEQNNNIMFGKTT